MLASDVNNPEFVGAMDPDSRLHVTFYSRPMLMEAESDKQKRAIYKDVVFTRIVTPGDNLNQIDRPKNDEDEQRFPKQWLWYKSTHGEDEQVIGTPLSQWGRITPSKAEELKFLKFTTVESIAFASDEQIGKLGMMAGMQPHSFREEAKRFVALSKDSAILAEEAEKAAKLEAKLKEQDDLIKQMQEQLAGLSKRKPGRPPKEAA